MLLKIGSRITELRALSYDQIHHQCSACNPCAPGFLKEWQGCKQSWMGVSVQHPLRPPMSCICHIIVFHFQASLGHLSLWLSSSSATQPHDLLLSQTLMAAHFRKEESNKQVWFSVEKVSLATSSSGFFRKQTGLPFLWITIKWWR